MPEASASAESWVRRRAPELALLVIAATMFLGRLGAMDLWGKREQRASAEALDTIEHDNWLVAYIQCRPRLEKPPLPRWTIAALMKVTGLQDEWIVRLPNALSALAMVGLVYGLGRRMAGRSVGLASGLALASTFFFVIESRQAGNDGPLAFFTTLALYAAFRRLHGVPAEEPCGLPAETLGGRGWSLLMWVAMGLGFLSKGPIAVVLPALAVVPYLVLARRFKAGSRALLDGWGVLAFLILALSWPVPVLLSDPRAFDIWKLEMGQKAGAAGITHHRQRNFAVEWPWMTAPWTLVATWAVLLPFFGRGREERPTVWFPWFWAVGNFAMFCLWSVAKPNYYVPCEPGVALLVGLTSVRLLALAREARGAASSRARRFLQFHWVAMIAMAVAAPILARINVPELFPSILPWILAGSVAMVLSVALSVWAWCRRADEAVMASLVGGLTVAVTIGYAAVVPHFNADKSHRGLAAELDRVLPRDAKTVMFFRELDEGLWFYLRGRTLAAVPGSTPETNKGMDLVVAARENRLIYDERERIKRDRKILVDWLEGAKHESPYVLIRARSYDLFNPGLDELVTPIFREPELDRHPLVLLRVRDQRAVASGIGADRK
ncbi:MAG: family glycosyltransferase, 4-amino-4-deoxy-L-arabinose transferase [Planctomycetota bacterium]|nr:family glycosyltransferase, 4-amino-4-deoxy-L-arabinose transferase [Planctomycetota bacterium]